MQPCFVVPRDPLEYMKRQINEFLPESFRCIIVNSSLSGIFNFDLKARIAISAS